MICPCYLHRRAPMPFNMANPCICECDVPHDQRRDQVADFIEARRRDCQCCFVIDEVDMARLLDLVWNVGYRHGYESPDMPADFTPLSPYSPDRLPGDYEWGDA